MWNSTDYKPLQFPHCGTGQIKKSSVFWSKILLFRHIVENTNCPLFSHFKPKKPNFEWKFWQKKNNLAQLTVKDSTMGRFLKKFKKFFLVFVILSTICITGASQSWNYSWYSKYIIYLFLSRKWKIVIDFAANFIIPCRHPGK